MWSNEFLWLILVVLLFKLPQFRGTTRENDPYSSRLFCISNSGIGVFRYPEWPKRVVSYQKYNEAYSQFHIRFDRPTQYLLSTVKSTFCIARVLHFSSFRIFSFQSRKMRTHVSLTSDIIGQRDKHIINQLKS